MHKHLPLIDKPEIQALLTKERDELKLVTQLQKWGYSLEERQFLGEYSRIAPALKVRFKTPLWLWADSLAMQQSTAADLSQYKAQLIPAQSRVADLCCGMGGDSFFLDASISVFGVDLSFYRLQMFAKNHSLLRPTAPSFAVAADVTQIPFDFDYFLLDPDRRDHSRQDLNWDIENLSPSINQVAAILQKHPNGLIKLSPAADHKALFESQICGDYEWIGNKSDCRELLVRCGNLRADIQESVQKLAQKETEKSSEKLSWGDVLISAVELESAQKLTYSQSEIDKATFDLSQDCHVPSEGDYIYEPLKTAVRSHTFAPLAQSLGLKLIDFHVAYLSSGELVEHTFLNAYKLIHPPVLQEKLVAPILKKLDVGEVIVKKRGIEINPNALALLWKGKKSAKVKIKDKLEVTIIVTRVSQKPIYFICQEVK